MITLTDAGKRYIKYEDEPMLLTRAFHRRSRRSKLWALRHLDMQVEAGQSIGIIGRNGSGKSTLLQLIAGVTAPTEGCVKVRGRIAPLVSVGVGFHPELTGRENIFINASILGLSRRQIRERFDAIVDFSGIPSFIDTPVKFYSSGMYIRLGFAVAVESAPDLLLVDEVLAVGDIGFQVKCFERMAGIRQAGTTILVVSHNLNAVRHLCERAVVLHNGEAQLDGDVDDGIAVYHRLLGEYLDTDRPDEGHVRMESDVAFIESIRLLDPSGTETSRVRSGDRITLAMDVRFEKPVARPVFGMAIISGTGVNVYSESTHTRRLPPVSAGERRSCRVQLPLPLTTGSYSIRAGVHGAEDDQRITTVLHEAPPVSFYVFGRPSMGGLVDLAAEFEVGVGRSDSPRPVIDP